MRSHSPGRADTRQVPSARRGIGFYATTVPPHGGTVRTQYTVGSGKMARITSGHLRLGLALSDANDEVYFILYVGADIAGRALYELGFAGYPVECPIGDCGSLWPGQVVQFRTEDLTSGGTVDYVGHVVIEEYDI